MRLARKNIEYSKILVVRFSSLGDLVLTTPVIEGLRRRFPKAEISFLLKAEYTPLFLNHSSNCKLIPLEDKVRKNSAKFIGFIDKLAESRYDLVVDLQANGRSFVIRRRLNTDYLLVKKRTFRRLMIVKFKIGAKGLPNVRDRFFEPLHRLGLADRAETSLSLSDEELSKAKNKFLRFCGDRPLALIHPCAKWPLKEWSKDNFSKLAGLLSAKGFSVAAFGSDLEGQAVPIEGTDLREMIACIALADIFIGNDSGPLHVAEAVKTPAVGIFGPTSEALGYCSKQTTIATAGLKLSCRPCSLFGDGVCKKGRRKCLDDLSPSEVLDLAMKSYENGHSR